MLRSSRRRGIHGGWALAAQQQKAKLQDLLTGTKSKPKGILKPTPPTQPLNDENQVEKIDSTTSAKPRRGARNNVTIAAADASNESKKVPVRGRSRKNVTMVDDTPGSVEVQKQTHDGNRSKAQPKTTGRGRKNVTLCVPEGRTNQDADVVDAQSKAPESALDDRQQANETNISLEKKRRQNVSRKNVTVCVPNDNPTQASDDHSKTIQTAKKQSKSVRQPEPKQNVDSTSTSTEPKPNESAPSEPKKGRTRQRQNVTIQVVEGARKRPINDDHNPLVSEETQNQDVESVENKPKRTRGPGRKNVTIAISAPQRSQRSRKGADQIEPSEKVTDSEIQLAGQGQPEIQPKRQPNKRNQPKNPSETQNVELRPVPKIRIPAEERRLVDAMIEQQSTDKNTVESNPVKSDRRKAARKELATDDPVASRPLQAQETRKSPEANRDLSNFEVIRDFHTKKKNQKINNNFRFFFFFERKTIVAPATTH